MSLARIVGRAGSRAPIGAPGAMPQGRAIATHVDRSGSWMLPEAKSEDLLYSSDEDGNVHVYSYPGLKEVGTLTNLNEYAYGECVDGAGDIFIATNGGGTKQSGTIFEYAHGGTEPIAELSDPGFAWGCSVDPTTGNLAVANCGDGAYSGGEGDLALYPGAQGPPTMYRSNDIIHLFFCGYDNKGNLYADGEGNSVLFELAKGSGSLTDITLNEVSKYFYQPAAVQWDGQYMTIGSIPYGPGSENIYRLQISGNNANVVGTTGLRSTRNRHNGQYWIQGKRVVATNDERHGSAVGLWKYPSGGKTKKNSKETYPDLFGVTVSVSPSR